MNKRLALAADFMSGAHLHICRLLPQVVKPEEDYDCLFGEGTLGKLQGGRTALKLFTFSSRSIKGEIIHRDDELMYVE